MSVGDTFNHFGDIVTVIKVTEHIDCGYRFRKVFFRFADGGTSFVYRQGWGQS